VAKKNAAHCGRLFRDCGLAAAKPGKTIETGLIAQSISRSQAGKP
jgi:hypothetical protein